MRASEWAGDEVVAALVAPVEPEFAGEMVVLTAAPSSIEPAAVERLATLPCVVVAGSSCSLDDPAVTALADVAATDEADLDDVRSNVAAHPVAGLSLVVLLRGAGRRSIAEGLQLESAVFSALQAGPEHAAWRTATPRSAREPDDGPRVRVERRGGTLHVALQRPATRNALDAAMRDQLLDALSIVAADPTLSLELSGDGPVFCSGGDLDEFGSRPDPATAHLLRLRRSLAGELASLASRTTARVQGRCAGSGVELAAFAGRVVAHPDASFVLPELSMGLIPGAGGTVSLPRRIGRHRTAHLALSGRAMDASTARSVGLVDEVALF